MLDTDWLTALLVIGGLLFIVLTIGLDSWRLVQGQFVFRPVARQSLFWRFWDTFYFAFAIFICVNFMMKSGDRLLRFAGGLLSLGLLVHLVMMWLHLANSTVQQLNIASTFTELCGFIFLAVSGLKWFRSKIVRG